MFLNINNFINIQLYKINIQFKLNSIIKIIIYNIN